MVRVGLISDTHGLVRPQAQAFLQGADLIIHAGDITTPEVLEQLQAVAPVIAVRGNNDKGAWAKRLAETEYVTVEQVSIYVIHDLGELDIDPRAAGVRIVVSGHSHKPVVQDRDGVLFVNPGSAGPRRFRLPISVGELNVDGARVSAQLTELICETKR